MDDKFEENDVWSESSAADEDAEQLADVAFGDDEPQGSPAHVMAGSQMPEQLRLPCTTATMLCMRGPCIFYWAWLQQTNSVEGDVLRVQLTSTCRRHETLQSLAGDRLFQCTEWWPKYLGFVPEFLRTLFQRSLYNFYDFMLRKVKRVDFSWRWWGKLRGEDLMALSGEEKEKLRAATRKRLGL